MSTTVIPAVPQNIAEAQDLLSKRLLPAKLDSSSKRNGQVFNTYLIAVGKAGLVLQMSGQQLAQELYNAIQADVQSEHPQLVWEKPPAALAKRFAKNEGPAKVGDPRAAAEFETRVRAGEKADEQRKVQEQAKKRCQELVGQFAPTNHRKGILNYGLRDEKQAEWRKQIAEAKDFVKLERAIADEQRKIYEKLERAAERI